MFAGFDLGFIDPDFVPGRLQIAANAFDERGVAIMAIAEEDFHYLAPARAFGTRPFYRR